MNIHKSKKKLRETSMLSIAEEGLARGNQVAFISPAVTTSTGSTAAYILNLNQQQVENMDRENRYRHAYNQHVHELDPEYMTLTPYRNRLIIRRYLRPSEYRTEKAGLYIPNQQLVGVQSNVAGVDGDPIKDPFNFSYLAVVVSAGDYLKESFPPGTLIQVPRPQAVTIGKGKDARVVGFMTEYMHPRFMGAETPTDPSDPDFGYSIISDDQIVIVVEKAELLLETPAQGAE